MLKTYTESAHRADLALELPTGTGKTLTGLLIAEWTRISRRQRVIYACPTKQLAKQVASAAYREGIDVALLIGSHTKWPNAAQLAYEAAEQVAVTTYSSIFNTNSHLAEADLILFDDAHAGEQYVGEAYSVNIKRWESPREYAIVLDKIAPALDGVFLDRLREKKPDPGFSSDVRMVVPLRQPGMVAGLASALSSFSDDHKFAFAMIRSGFESCLVYVSHGGMLIRPYVPPTHQNGLFSNARQRVYLSATLGEGGELERAFGRTSIERLAQPGEDTAPRYGRRFFVFPDFIDNSDPTELSKRIVAEAGKALILAPRTETAVSDASALAQKGWPVWGVEDVKDGMAPFASLDNGTCGLAARYDGLDLPGDSCRVVVLDGIPDQDNLQERFLQSRARAGVALAARIRTRVIQGAGRCTRGPEDTAIVIILGAGLSRYLTRPEVVAALDSELQAEIRFGRENSQSAFASDVLANTHAFLNQDTDDVWRTDAEPTLTDYRRDMTQEMPVGTASLASCADEEIRAWAAAAVAAWAEAAQHAHEVVRLAGAEGKPMNGYVSFWIYLEAAWADQAAEMTGDSAGRAAAQTLVRRAEDVMGLGSWVRQMSPFPAMERSPLGPIDAHAVATIAAQLTTGANQGKTRRRIGEIHAGLKETAATKYEPALTELGRMVGATASKPPEKGRCDSTWCWSNELWLALEAKSEHEPTGVVPHKDIRQANDQLRLLASDRNVTDIPLNSATVIISPKPGVQDDGIKGAEAHVHLVPPSTIQDIAYDVEAAWEELLTKSAGRDPEAMRSLVGQAFYARGVLPTQLHERLTFDPIGVRPID